MLSQLQAGAPAREIISNIRETYPVTMNRARLIAFDQIGKFNGAIDKVRFENLGVEKYRWRTQGDLRVRPEHEELEGEVRSWDDSPIPGQEIRCRCWAEPVLDDA
jgi:SPP1 gp7 family putative phage head morphogenesis protein